jgi:hypothetical protein
MVLGAATGAIKAHRAFGLPLDLDSISATVADTIFSTLDPGSRESMRLEICEILVQRRELN